MSDLQMYTDWKTMYETAKEELVNTEAKCKRYEDALKTITHLITAESKTEVARKALEQSNA